MPDRLIIAIDGPSASGKGTLARRLAKHFGLPHLDTGALYRGVALTLLREGADLNDPVAAIAVATDFKNGLDPSLLNTDALRSEAVGMLAGKVSAIPEVRAQLLDFQKQFASQEKGAVLDGRDIGTVIAPNAPVKVFVTASAEKRAERRLKELQNGGQKVTYEAVLKDMQERDARDAARSVAPARPAQDAVMLDTSNLDADQAFAEALKIVKEKTGM
jgi:cytidylate kinase